MNITISIGYRPTNNNCNGLQTMIKKLKCQIRKIWEVVIDLPDEVILVHKLKNNNEFR